MSKTSFSRRCTPSASGDLEACLCGARSASQRVNPQYLTSGVVNTNFTSNKQQRTLSIQRFLLFISMGKGVMLFPITSHFDFLVYESLNLLPIQNKDLYTDKRLFAEAALRTLDNEHH